MDNSKRPASTTVTRNIYDFSKDTENIYETVALISKRSNQISQDLKKELHKKIDEFSSSLDTIDEVYENREQIEIVRRYEQMPKPTLIATKEYLNDELYYRNPSQDNMAAKPQSEETSADTEQQK